MSRAKHEHILNTATQVFLERGFAATSMDAVALRAGVSKATIYSHFGSKQDLFGAIIDALAKRLLVDIGKFEIDELSPELMLERVGKAYLDIALTARSLDLHRLIVVEAARTPGLGELIIRNGPARLVAALASYIDRQPALRVPDATLAAEQFLGMVLGQSQLRLLLGSGSLSLARDKIDRLVQHAVQIFLQGALAR